MSAAESQRLDGQLVDHTPHAREWAAFFSRYPAELARLSALDELAGNEVPNELPTGARSTAAGYARWFAAHPDQLAALAAPLLVPRPEPEIRRDAKGRRIF